MKLRKGQILRYDDGDSHLMIVLALQNVADVEHRCNYFIIFNSQNYTTWRTGNIRIISFPPAYCKILKD